MLFSQDLYRIVFLCFVLFFSCYILHAAAPKHEGVCVQIFKKNQPSLHMGPLNPLWHNFAYLFTRRSAAALTRRGKPSQLQVRTVNLPVHPACVRAGDYDSLPPRSHHTHTASLPPLNIVLPYSSTYMPPRHCNHTLLLTNYLSASLPSAYVIQGKV